ncbi:class I SAM-dependent methyltransferase [Halobacterium yunchengense]|uniref:class I SAM-dependent methyltransferase n=1 Tax=Halobacterium yunchengense TaxID=3108497 RepID=UPI003009E9DB
MPGDHRDGDGVHRTYDYIAAHFAKTREYAWPEVEAFLEGRTASLAVDVGCGNGRHTELLAARADRALGVDASTGLLGEAGDRAAERGFDADLVAGDAARLPLRDGVADLAVYVATVHHLGSRADRVASFDELARVLAPGGAALVSAWSTEHDRFEDEASRAPDGRAAADSEPEREGFDTAVDWTLPGGETVPRFYHIYHPPEFRADLEASALAVEDAFVSSGNCYAVVRPASGA